MARIAPLAAGLVAAFLISPAPDPSGAATQPNAKVLIHLASTTTSHQCTRPEAHPPCAGVVTAGGLYPTLYFAYLLVADGDPATGIGGAQFGIDYGSGPADGVGLDIFSWTLCATLIFQVPNPVWPASGGSVGITWDTTTRCQRDEPGGPGTGVVGTLGYFYCAAYSPVALRIAPWYRTGHPEEPGNNKVKIADCNASETVIYDGTNPPSPSPLGFVRFSESGTESGYNPCQQVIPVKPSTWSAVKTQFN